MLAWIKSWFVKPPCTHPNAQENKWLDPDNTPMVDWWCPDCGLRDHGHVYADPETWLEDEPQQCMR
jgi:hypothetical protein